MLDTNILVSLIFFPSETTREFEKAITRNHHIVLCDYVIKELETVVDRKFPTKVRAIQIFFRDLPYELVYTPSKIQTDIELNDKDDIPILNTAVVEDIDIFITGDKGFDDIDIACPRIMTIREFLNEI